MPRPPLLPVPPDMAELVDRAEEALDRDAERRRREASERRQARS